MVATYYQDFARDDGSPITVEYSARNGGEIEIVGMMPNTPEYEALCKESLRYFYALSDGPWGYGGDEDVRQELLSEQEKADDAVKAAREAMPPLTAAECDRMIAYIAEHHDFTEF